MLLLLLACLPPPTSDTSAGAALPSWSGTQIGEEGDEGCGLSRSEWTEEEQGIGEGKSPAQLREELSTSAQGLLETLWEGQASMSLELNAAGQAWLVQEQPLDPDMECSDSWLEIDTELVLDAGELLRLETQLSLRPGGWSVGVEAARVFGKIGVDCPSDASELELRVLGDDQGHGDLRWELERPSGREYMDVGSWTVGR